MKKTLVACIALALPLLAEETFKPPCTLPFEALSKKEAIDSDCGMAGATKGKPALAAQDTAKNNFCATGKPVVLTFDAYPGLQAAAEKVLGGANYEPPEDRSGLKDLYTWKKKKIGEGMVVSVVGFVEAAHYSDVSDGESVNCELKEDANNDIHIPIVPTAGVDECSSVTAEISPHYRPEVWTASHVNKPGVPMRFTGQLMFDAEHRPCHDGKAQGPKRTSVWEIHPVYAMDVCTAAKLSECDGENEKMWVPLDQWLKQQ